MKILILGANGFIGCNLVEAILQQKDWEIYAIDLAKDKLTESLKNSRFNFLQGDIRLEKNWIENQIKQCDVVLPLVAVATPATYVSAPLTVFELDFEANLEIVRLCVQYQKRLIFPSTSEVYGMCTDLEFDEENSHLVTGPIHKERWIYSTSKQLMDRIIYAYGKHHNLAYTLFRPFNWYGPRLDDVLNPKQGASRVLTQFIGNILRGENIILVGGGAQQRCFTYVDDGITALLRIIENPKIANQQIFNIGNPNANLSIKSLAEKLVELIKNHFQSYADKVNQVQLQSLDAKEYYGSGYQDVSLRVPNIQRARQHLNWEPHVDIETGLMKTLNFYLKPAQL